MISFIIAYSLFNLYMPKDICMYHDDGRKMCWSQEAISKKGDKSHD